MSNSLGSFPLVQLSWLLAVHGLDVFQIIYAHENVGGGGGGGGSSSDTDNECIFESAQRLHENLMGASGAVASIPRARRKLDKRVSQVRESRRLHDVHQVRSIRQSSRTNRPLLVQHPSPVEEKIRLMDRGNNPNLLNIPRKIWWSSGAWAAERYCVAM